MIMFHVTRDEMDQLEVYKEVGKLEESIEQFEEEAQECDEDKEVAFSTLVWLGKLLREILK